MKIIELINNGGICINLQSVTKTNVIQELAKTLLDNGTINSIENFTKDIWAREKQSSTAIGESVAIPHAKSSSVIKPAIVFGRSDIGIDYEAIDRQPAKLFFMIAVPKGELKLHLVALSKLCRKLIYPEIKEKLLKSKNIEEIKEIFKEME